MTLSDFHHIFLPGDLEKPVLLLLHGTGGDEHDLIPLAQAVDATAAILSIRGKVLENGMPRFFRRLSEGVFDLEDLVLRTEELADFIAVARQHYGLQQSQLMVLGFSNGANIAANMLFQRPEAVDGAMLLRAMVTKPLENLPDLSAKSVLMLSGLMDPIIPMDNSKALAEFFEKAGADIIFTAKPVTHGLVQSDIQDMKAWLSK